MVVPKAVSMVDHLVGQTDMMLAAWTAESMAGEMAAK
jgi:hypothetical protein